MKKIILVTDATSAEGSSVATALLKDKKFGVRILISNTNSPKAIALQKEGAELAEGNMEDMDNLKNAMKDVYGVFGEVRSYTQGKNLINAVNESTVVHFVLSSSLDYHQLSNGELPVPALDTKAAIERYSRSVGLPATYLHGSFYYENFLHLFPLQKADDNNYYFGFPQGNTRLSMYSVEDTGGIVAGIFDRPEYIGHVVGAVATDRTCTEYARIMSETLQKQIHYKHISHSSYSVLPEMKDAANMFEVQKLFIPNRQIQMIECYGLYPEMQSFEDWMACKRYRFIHRFETTTELIEA